MPCVTVEVVGEVEEPIEPIVPPYVRPTGVNWLPILIAAAAVGLLVYASKR